MPRLESEFENKDLIAEQFQDMEEVICYMASQLNAIANGQVDDPNIHAFETLRALPHIWTPIVRLRLG